MKSIKLILSFLLMSKIVIGCRCPTIIQYSDRTIKELNQGTINLLETNVKLNLVIRRDSLNMRTIFYLEDNNELIDSSIVDNVNFKFDSLSILEETKWHYIYSSPFKTSGIDLYKQIIIEILDNKIHFSYVGTYRYSSLQDKNQSYGYFWDKRYRLNLKDSTLGSHLKFTKTTHNINENNVQIDSSENIILLDYDSEKRVYYNKIDTLNGIYSFWSSNLPNGFTKVHINNEAVLTIEFENNNSYVYYKGKWFALEGYKEEGYHQSIYPFQNITDDWFPTKK